MPCECRCVDVSTRILGDRIGILHILIGKGFHRIGIRSVFGDHMSRHVRSNIQSKVPGNGHQCVVDPHQWTFQAVLGRGSWIITFLGNRPSSDRGIPIEIDGLRLFVWENDDVMTPTLVHDNVVLIWGHPFFKGSHREILTKGILMRLRPSFLPDRPSVDLVSAGDDAIVTGCSQYLGIPWGQRNFVGRGVIWRGHVAPLLIQYGCCFYRISAPSLPRRRYCRPSVPGSPVEDSDRPVRKR